ncbi:helix-turn-helix transcriptional regulator [Lysinibacillus pakistanensis]|uniref:LuxR family transcriptional regulator n=1 Tax=Lysinibacillus pakistanensis TaxID=759811 RepID=A0ABX6D4T9_9BACI|nr:LuxR family transcriptional regulator [Lysinibacillus pakistanensis]
MKDTQYWRRKSEQCLKHSENSFEYRQLMIEALRTQINFDAYCCTLTDAHTLFSVGAVTEHSIEAIHQEIMELEYAVEDMNKYEFLVRSGQHIGRLSDSTSQSFRYREVLEPNGFSDELRAALIYQEQCYGFLTLFKRAESEPPFFQDEDLALIEIVMPIMGERLKEFHHYIIEERLPTVEGEQGIVIIDKELRVLSSNTKAYELLSILRKYESLTEWQVPKPIQAICASLLADSYNTNTSLIVPIKDTGYIAIRASLMLTSLQEQQIALLINEASSREMLNFLIMAYNLTPREKEVVFEIIKGIPTKEIAFNLGISHYTVQDHLKVIFQKVKVSNRNELVWKIFSRFQLD